MKITTLSTTVLAAILGFAFAGAPLAVNAQTTTPTTSTTPATPDTTKPEKKKKDANGKIPFKGSVTAIDTKANTLTVDTSKKKDGSKTLALTLSPATVYKTGGKNGTSAAETDVKVGADVTGSYTKDASGTMTAASVYIK